MSQPLCALSLVIIFCLFATPHAHADAALEKAGEWMAHYYEKPDPEGLPAWVRTVAEAGGFDKPASRGPLMIFISEVMRAEPARMAGWCAGLAKLPPHHRSMIGWAVRNAAVPEHEACIQSQLGLADNEKQQLMALERYNPLQQAPLLPGDLDMLWAVFMATGDAEAVERIIDVLGTPLPQRAEAGSIEQVMLIGAAKWSLASNIRQHARVAEIAHKRLARESGFLRDELAEVINGPARKAGGPAAGKDTPATNGTTK